MSFILTQHIDKVLLITLNRADKFNSFNREMALDLIRVLDQAGTDPSVRAILLTGSGKAFCAGQDLAEAIDPKGPGIEKIVREHYNPIIQRIRTIEKPVVAAVNGVAAGAGANIALACDVILAASSASFIQAFSKIGLIPDSGGTFTLPRLIGFQRASALMMTGDKLSASDALQYGMIYKVVDDVELAEKSMQQAKQLAELPTKAIGLTKRLLNQSHANTLDQQLELEKQIQVESANSYDYREGVNAFLEKRKPVFKGE